MNHRLPILGILLASPALLAGLACHAQPADTTQSTACQQALQALQTREAAMQAAASAFASPATTQADAGWKNLRRHAAQACLGGTGYMPPPARNSQAPIAIALPPIGSTAPYASPSRSSATGSTIPVARPPSAVTSCDALGCWANDGTRLNRVGPQQLQGPRGLCTLLGSSLQCP